MILHTVKTSPFSNNSLQQCLAQLAEQDLLLLVGDAVIAATVSLPYLEQLSNLTEQQRLFILSEDLQARALTANLGQVVGYKEFVELTIECNSQLSW